MNHMDPRPLAAMLLVSVSLLSTPAHADDTALPPAQTQGEATFLSGGIGSDETAAIKAAASGYALTLLFATSGGGGHDAFLASIPVSIRDAGGNVVLDTVTDGPYLLVNLAPGHYKISASHEGVERRLSVDLKAGAPQQRSVTWPQRAKDVVSAPAAPAAASTIASGAPSSDLPAPGNQGGVPYVSGGIGSEESRAIKAQFPRYAMALTFASVQNGHNVFLASVPVQIRDATGTTVLDVTTEGPYLLVDVPPGKYEVVATHGGKEKRVSVQVVAGRNVQRAFSWATP